MEPRRPRLGVPIGSDDAVGIAVEASVWSLLPAWYHIIFLVLLIPVTMAGGRLKKTA